MTALRYTADSFSEEKFCNCGKMVAVVMNYNKKGMIGRAVEAHSIRIILFWKISVGLHPYHGSIFDRNGSYNG